MIIRKKSKKGMNQKDIQEMNRSLVVRLLRNKKICSRADLAKETGLEQATITNIINDFLDWDLVIETGIIDGKKGRRSIGISLNKKKFKSLGVKISKKYFSIGLFDILGTEYNIKLEYIDVYSDLNMTLKKVKKAINKYLEEYLNKEKIIGIGIAVPGTFLKGDNKRALMSEFSEYNVVLAKSDVKSNFNIPVFLEHDVSAGASAEWWYGSMKREEGTLIFILAGEGIGAGIVIDGNIYKGSLGLAGNIGHTIINFNGPRCRCGSKGCLELYCSTIAIVDQVKSRLINYPNSVLNKDFSWNSILSAYKNGDELAERTINKAVKFLGLGVVNVINSYNPDSIIIGDVLTQVGPKIIEIVKSVVKKHISPDIYKNVKIEISLLKNDPTLIGASFLPIENILKNPSLINELC